MTYFVALPLNGYIEQGNDLLRLFFLEYLRRFNEELCGNNETMRLALLWCYILSVALYYGMFVLAMFQVSIFVRKKLFGRRWDRETLQRMMDETRDYYHRNDDTLKSKLKRIQMLKKRYQNRFKDSLPLQINFNLYELDWKLFLCEKTDSFFL